MTLRLDQILDAKAEELDNIDYFCERVEDAARGLKNSIKRFKGIRMEEETERERELETKSNT